VPNCPLRETESYSGVSSQQINTFTHSQHQGWLFHKGCRAAALPNILEKIKLHI
jgi:hypothetical protein